MQAMFLSVLIPLNVSPSPYATLYPPASRIFRVWRYFNNFIEFVSFALKVS